MADADEEDEGRCENIKNCFVFSFRFTEINLFDSLKYYYFFFRQKRRDREIVVVSHIGSLAAF